MGGGSPVADEKGAIMPDKTKLLIVDDDIPLREALALHLEDAGFQIVAADNGSEALEKLFRHRPHLVLLDIMMPGLDGWETCTRIREFADVPIIMLTALGQDGEKVKGLDLGADDYLVKPVSLQELEARIRAVLRRVDAGQKKQPGVLYADGWLVIDAAGWQVRCNGESVELTATERKLLFLLAENGGRILPNSVILERVWGHEYVDDTDYVKLYIWRLRQQIEPDPKNPTYIQTEYGVGYRFVPHR